MGKAARNRGARIPAGSPITQLPRSTIFPGFPYARKFTQDEIEGDILPRVKRLGDAMRDGKAPTGATLFIPPDLFEMWMVHAALAGCDVDPDKAYIVSRRQPGAMFNDAVDWVAKTDVTQEMEDEDAEQQAQRLVDAMDETLDPQVREAVRARMIAGAQQANDFLAPGNPAQIRNDFRREFGPPRQQVIRPDDEKDKQ